MFNLWQSIINIIYVGLAMFINLFPTADPSTVSTINSTLNSFRNYVSTANWIFPVGTFFTIIGLIIAIESSWLTYKFFRWLISSISVGFIK